MSAKHPYPPAEYLRAVNKIREQLLEARQVLDDFLTDADQIHNIEKAARLMVAALKAEGKILACGNGGSMCDAMHFAEELSGRFRDDRPPLGALSLSDPSHITCTANDYGFERIFARQVEALGRKGDVLLAISTSGNSPNILRAAEKAREKGMKVIALTGKSGGQLAQLADVEVRAPDSPYSDRAQEIHIKVIHAWIYFIEGEM